MSNIPSSELRYIRRRLFEGRFTATALATRVRVSANTFWQAWHRPNGISTDMARKIADALLEWSSRLQDTAIELNALARTYEERE